MGQLSHEVHLAAPVSVALETVRTALKDEGFGVLTEIDLQAAFREKLGRDFRPYVILGACNPPLAFAAVSADPEVGVLLPCNVIVESDGAAGTTVRLTDPRALLGSIRISDASALEAIARDAGSRMERVAAALRAG